jgi:hypothetical protein
MDVFFPFFAFALFAIVIVLSLVRHFGRSSSLLQQWVAQNGHRVVRQEYRTFFRGPFFWTTTKGQTVYYVAVEDPTGKQRAGWELVVWPWSNSVEVRWDERRAMSSGT